MRESRSILFILLSGFLFFGCEKQEMTLAVRQDDGTPVSQEELIPMQNAVSTLEDFLSDTHIPLSRSKGDGGREIAGIYSYYSSQRDVQDQDVPDAYIVNFEDRQGFAVLGARSDMVPVVAVVENGTIDPMTLKLVPPETAELDSTEVSWVSFIETAIKMGLTPISSRGGGTTPILPDPGDEPGPGGNVTPYIHYSAHVNTTWSQGAWNSAQLYNNYCYENLLIGGFTYVYTGCSTTAMAGIVEYNRFPTTLTVNGRQLDYTSMDVFSNAYALPSSTARDDVGRLMGSIYHNVSHFSVTSNGTCITPSQIVNCMMLFGYTNVVKMQGSSYTDAMISATKTMLAANKPVFISAIPSSNILDAHSWIIDEIKGRTAYTVHCNWGWSGNYDGFYSTACFNPNGTLFNFHFRVITYDIPNGTTNVNITF